jgi:hypothetical protein
MALFVHHLLHGVIYLAVALLLHEALLDRVGPIGLVIYSAAALLAHEEFPGTAELPEPAIC